MEHRCHQKQSRDCERFHEGDLLGGSLDTVVDHHEIGVELGRLAVQLGVVRHDRSQRDQREGVVQHEGGGVLPTREPPQLPAEPMQW